MRIKKQSYRWFATTFLLGLLLFLQGVPAVAYEAWHPEEEQEVLLKLNDLLDQISFMLGNAKANKAAHPNFLRDLENVLAQLYAHRDVIAESYSGGNYSDYSGGEYSYGKPQTVIEPEMRYLGRTADKVGSWEKAVPDGKNDEHIQVLVYFPTKVTIESLRLYSSTQSASRGNTWWWSDSTGQLSPRRAWVLGVFHEGRMLNPNRETTLGTFQGWTLFDLYASAQSDIFANGKYSLLEMKTNQGEWVTLFRSPGIETSFPRP